MLDYGEFVGIEELHVANVTDSPSAYVGGTPEAFVPAASIIYDAKPSKKTTYYNNMAKRTYYGEGDGEVKIVVPGLTVAGAAELVGKSYDAASGRMYDGKDPNPPFKALAYKVNVGHGHFRYVQYLKGTFSLGNEEHATKKNGEIDEKTMELIYTPVVTDYQWTVDGTAKGLCRVVGDTTDAAFVAAGFFSQVQTPATAGAPDALALSSSSPADGASGSSKTASLTATFNNVMNQTNTKFTLVDATAKDKVAVTVTWDATGKIATLAHAALSGTTVHVLVYNAVDIYGQTLNGVLDFTTAA